jgi:dTDP-4-dehydrorhamnose 3,5-epimerase
MKKIPTIFPEVWVIEPDVFPDDRGFFFESYSEKKWQALGLSAVFIQDNHARSVQNTVRGLHFQANPGQLKLVRCSLGSIWDVVVDIRPTSPNFKKWTGVELSSSNNLQIWVPVGFAHGYAVLSDVAEVQYKVTNYYDPSIERGFRFDDPAIGVDWKVKTPILSKRDLNSDSFTKLLTKYPDPFIK